MNFDRNVLFYGDNIDILRDYIPTESVDLIYLDPPFNSNRSYNVLFKDESGQSAEAQIAAFDDTWHWGPSAEQTLHKIIRDSKPEVIELIKALHGFIGRNQMMAYLVMMTARLSEMHRILKPKGSLYLHCDPTASHYLKIILDVIFGKMNLRNEIIWSYKRYTAVSNRYQKLHDTILFYGKSEEITFNEPRDEYGEKSGKSDSHYKQDEDGSWYRWQKRKGQEPYKIYLSEGRRLGDVWDIPIINASAKERLGYPTQKPLALLERIILASSNPGDLVLDPFSGCGTAITAAQKLGRRWIGIDITHLAIFMHKLRLRDSCGLEPKRDYDVIGEPKDIGGAHQLASENRYQFQWWILSEVHARPYGSSSGTKEGKKGSDKGIDGLIYYEDKEKQIRQIIFQVKSGKVSSAHIRDLRGVVERENAAIGVFITLEPPSSEMITEAVASGYTHSKLWNKDYPRIQILTVEEILNGKQVDMPPLAQVDQTFRKAPREKQNVEDRQLNLLE